MASVFAHPAPALAVAAAFGPNIIPPRLAVVTVLAAIMPDLDVAGFAFGVKYAEALGHRGLSHSLVFALGLGFLALLAAPLMKARRIAAFLAVTLAVLSHIFLDAATTGGLGVAFFWPVDETRHFLPWRPIAVSPFSPKAFFSAWGKRVILTELRWVWAPCLAFALTGILLRRAANAMKPGPVKARYPKHPGDPVR
ncbi:metal-dependent hydrolase [Desulfovibrio sp. OttesenSCG-928-O18]|nr:metal-dependent hydrolase [Desulfovibrio sp. OttesenSCG-928-O18]